MIGHGGAGRQPHNVAARGVGRELILDRMEDAPEVGRLAQALVAVPLDEKAPAVPRAHGQERVAGHERRHDDEAVALGEPAAIRARVSIAVSTRAADMAPSGAG
jgi:hypothetical protein